MRSLAILSLSFMATQASDTNASSPEVFYSMKPGTAFAANSEVRRNGRVVRTTRSVITALPAQTIDGRSLHVFEVRGSMTSPAGDEFPMHFRFFQEVTSDHSCTFAMQQMGNAPGTEERIGCEYVDLKAPVRVGAKWAYHATTPLYAWETELQVAIAVESQILREETLPLATGSTARCIVVEEIGRASPKQPVTCKNGSKELVDVETRRLRWFCPGMPDAKTITTERYLRRSLPTGECCRFEGTDTLSPTGTATGNR